jgi:hypothetical protein
LFEIVRNSQYREAKGTSGTQIEQRIIVHQMGTVFVLDKRRLIDWIVVNLAEVNNHMNIYHIAKPVTGTVM